MFAAKQWVPWQNRDPEDLVEDLVSRVILAPDTDVSLASLHHCITAQIRDHNPSQGSPRNE